MRSFNPASYARSGGYEGWLIVGIVFVSAGLAVGSVNYTFGLFIEPLEQTFGWQRTAISAAVSFMAVGSLTSPILGRLMDRYGSKVVMAGCLGLMGVSFLLRPMMTDLWQWYALSFLQFVGLNGAAALPAGKLVGSWFRTRAGRVMGLTMMGVNFGGITLPLIVGPILASGNWQLAYQLYAIMAFVFAGAVLAFVNDPPATALAESAVHHSKVAAIGRRRRPPAPLSFTVRQALRTRTFYALTLAIMLSSFTHTAVLPQVAAHFSSQGVSRATVPLVISLLSACGMAAKPIFGFLSERLGAKMAMMISLTGQSVGLAYIALASTTAAVWTSVALFGLFMGAHSVMIPLLTRDSFGLRNIGSIMGLITMSAVLPWAIGPVLAGLSYDIGGTYAYGFVGVAVGYVVGVMALTQVKRMDEMERR